MPVEDKKCWQAIVTENKIKTKLKAGGRVFGTWSMLASPSVMNAIGHAGLDFVIIDMEHGPMSFETAESQIYATESSGCTPIIRLGEGNELTILHALEIGVKALLVSHVSTAQEALRIVQATKYFPEGNRGLSPFTRNHGYSDIELAPKLRYANDQLFVGILVEGEEGIRNLEEIAQVPGLDLIYLGLYDISQAVGIPGELTHPKVLKLVKECVKLIEAHRRVAGSIAWDKNYLQFLFESGFRFISYRVDCAILRDGFDTARHWYEELLKGQR